MGITGTEATISTLYLYLSKYGQHQIHQTTLSIRQQTLYITLVYCYLLSCTHQQAQVWVLMAFPFGVTTSPTTRSPDMTSSIQAGAGAGLAWPAGIKSHPTTPPSDTAWACTGQPEVRVRSLAFLATGSSHLRTPVYLLPGQWIIFDLNFLIKLHWVHYFTVRNWQIRKISPLLALKGNGNLSLLCKLDLL